MADADVVVDTGHLDQPAVNMHRALLWTSRYVERDVEVALAPLRLSTTKFYVLLTLSYAPDFATTPTQIGRAIERSERVNLTAVLDRLEQDQLIQREPHPTDRRALMVRLTEQGVRMVNEAKALYVPAIDTLAKRLTDTEVTILQLLLKKLATD